MRNVVRFIALSCIGMSTHAMDVVPYIVNGSDADVSDYPSFASVYYRNGGVYSSSPICGATMINPSYALTAAHCIYGDDEQMLYTVIAPQLENKSNFLSSQQAKGVEFYYPDDYVESSRVLWPNDIAIIKLDTPLAVSDYSDLLNATANNTLPNGGEYKAVGHGYTNGNVPSGDRLQETDLTFIDNNTCRTNYDSRITNSHLCFSGQLNAGFRNSTCGGDSGGPVYWYTGGQYIQVGVTSFGPEVCGDATEPVTSVFTDVYDYLPWINSVINGLETPKAYVSNDGGTRTLINNDTGRTLSAVSGSSSDSGGGISTIWLMLIALLGWSRHVIRVD